MVNIIISQCNEKRVLYHPGLQKPDFYAMLKA